MPVIDVTSPIMNAYFNGVRLRLAKEAEENNQMVEQQKMQEQSKQFQAQMKDRGDQRKQELQFHTDTAKARDAENKAKDLSERLKQKWNVASDINRFGGGQFPVTKAGVPNGTDWSPANKNLQKPSYTQEPEYGRMQFPSAYEGQPEVSLGREDVAPIPQSSLDRQAQFENARTIAGGNMEQRERDSKRDFESTQARTEMMGAIAKIADSARGSQDEDRKERFQFRKTTAINSEANTVRRDKSYLNYLAADNAYRVTKDLNVSGVDANTRGITDMTLIYQWLKSQDGSTVREGEVRALQNAAGTIFDNFGLKLNRVMSGTDVFTPTTRQRLIKDIKKYHEAKSIQFKGIMNGAYNRANKIHPELDKEDFMRTIIENDSDPDILSLVGGLPGGNTSVKSTTPLPIPDGWEVVK